MSFEDFRKTGHDLKEMTQNMTKYFLLDHLNEFHNDGRINVFVCVCVLLIVCGPNVVNHFAA